MFTAKLRRTRCLVRGIDKISSQQIKTTVHEEPHLCRFLLATHGTRSRVLRGKFNIRHLVLHKPFRLHLHRRRLVLPDVRTRAQGKNRSPSIIQR